MTSILLVRLPARSKPIKGGDETALEHIDRKTREIEKRLHVVELKVDQLTRWKTAEKPAEEPERE